MDYYSNDKNIDNEIHLKDLVRSIKLCFRLFKSNFKIIFLASIISGLIALGFTFYSSVKFKAELRFIVKNEASNSGLNGMLGGLGSVLGASSLGSPLERTIEIAGSDRILGSALLSEVDFENRKVILANILIRLNNLDKVRGDNHISSNIHFTNQDSSIEKLTFTKRKAIKTMEGILIPKTGDGIVSKSFDKKSGVVTLAALHENEEFAIVLTKEIFNKLRDFYVEQMTTSAVNNVVILQKKVDSIKFELAKVQSSYARTTDQSFGLLFQEDKVELKKLAVREQLLLAMYAEAQKNLETFKFMNDSAIPTLTVIDTPYSPLKKIQKSKIFYLFGGLFIGAFFSFLIIGFRSWYKKLMSS